MAMTDEQVVAERRFDDGEISLWVLMQIVKQYRWTIIASTVTFTALAVAAAFLMTPIYRAQVVLVPAEEPEGGGLSSMVGRLGGLAQLTGLGTAGVTRPKDEALALLKSRAFTEAFMRDENLLPVLYADIWDSANQRWQVDSPEDIPTYNKAYRKFDRDIRAVSEDAATGLVTLSIEYPDRAIAAKWASQLVERLNNTMRERSIAEAQRSLEYLNGELAEQGVVEVRNAIYGLIESQIKAIMLARGRPEYSFRVIDPAVAPDEDDFVRPKRMLMIVLGPILGALVGLILALMHHAYRRAAAHSLKALRFD